MVKQCQKRLLYPLNAQISLSLDSENEITISDETNFDSLLDGVWYVGGNRCSRPDLWTIDFSGQGRP